jgi:hypothetical protein
MPRAQQRCGLMERGQIVDRSRSLMQGISASLRFGGVSPRCRKTALQARSSSRLIRGNFPFHLAFLVALAVFQSEGRRLDAVRDIEDER